MELNALTHFATSFFNGSCADRCRGATLTGSGIFVMGGRWLLYFMWVRGRLWVTDFIDGHKNVINLNHLFSVCLILYLVLGDGRVSCTAFISCWYFYFFRLDYVLVLGDLFSCVDAVHRVRGKNRG